MNDAYNLRRFLDAQASTIDHVRAQLQEGRKTSHWMWFIFPQIQGLGHSAMARRYAIGSLAEARAYLKHDILGSRLNECTQLVTLIDGRSVREIFGSPDDLKFRSSMTLFAHATSDNHVFIEALQKYWSGQFDEVTLERLNSLRLVP
jgi:uncharacterized protein (DUF1810 family)